MGSKVVSGIMLSLLLIGMLTLAFNIQPTGAESRLSLETDKDVYNWGENVMIILTNVGNRTEWIGGYPAWRIYTYPEGEYMHPDVFETLLWSLKPGENDTYTWNQRIAHNTTSVRPGMFVVNDTQRWGLTKYFRIYAPVGGIYIPVNKLELLAPYVGLTTLLAVAVMTVGYVKKRKMHTEIIS